MKRARAPARLKDPAKVHHGVYAGIDWHNSSGDPVIYIGGPNYDSSSQIHLTERQLLRLAPWIARAAAWAKGRA